MTLTFLRGLFGRAAAALLTEQFDVALLLNPGEDSDVGADVCKGSGAGMRGVTSHFHFLVQSFCKCFLYASLFCFNCLRVSHLWFRSFSRYSILGNCFLYSLHFWALVNLSFFFGHPIVSISKPKISKISPTENNKIHNNQFCNSVTGFF